MIKLLLSMTTASLDHSAYRNNHSKLRLLKSQLDIYEPARGSSIVHELLA